MKVLWISQDVPFPPKTGVLLRNYNLIRLASRFATIDLIAIKKDTTLPSSYAEMALPELKKLCSDVQTAQLPAEESRLKLLSVLLKSLFTDAPFTVNWATAPRLKEMLSGALSGSTYDLVYFDSVSLAGFRHLASSAARVLNHHNIESQLLERRIKYERNLLKKLYLRLESRRLRHYEAAAVGDFDSNLMVSSLDASRLREFCSDAPTALVANGVDISYFRPSDDASAEPGHLIMVSGMNCFPNLDAVLYMTQKVWPALSRTVPGVKLTIVGARLLRQARELAARDSRITVTGFVDDIRPYMDRAQVYVCPMHDGSGTCLTILAALSMGKPIVATTMALEGIDVMPEQDVLVGNTTDAFVSQIQRLIRDQALRQRLSRNGRTLVERQFSWEVIGQQLEQAFRDAVTSGRRHE